MQSRWAAWHGMQTAQATTPLLLLLLVCGAAPHVHPAVIDPQGRPDTTPAPKLPAKAAAPEQARKCLLRAFKTPHAHERERKVFSQYGEDGILESIFGCIGTTDKYFVEFGVEDGRECTTRNLRESHGFTGLMMDGGNSRPEINLQQEMMFSHNIVQLFQKHKVLQPGFDHLTVDIDQNTFWVALALLRAGYRPRSLAAEMNRNLAWKDSYATIDMPEEMAFFHDACSHGGCSHLPRKSDTGDCYFGASTTAWAVMLRSFGYHLVYSDAIGVNVFFVHESVVGSEPLISIAEAKQYFTHGGEYVALHGYCMRRPWVVIDPATNYSDPALDVDSLPLVFLSHKAGGERFKQRVFYEVKLSHGLQEQLRSGMSGGLKKQLELGRGRAPASDSQLGSVGVGSEAANRKDRDTMLQAWSVGVLVVVAFVCGALLHRFGGRLLRANSTASRGNKYSNV